MRDDMCYSAMVLMQAGSPYQDRRNMDVLRQLLLTFLQLGHISMFSTNTNMNWKMYVLLINMFKCRY